MSRNPRILILFSIVAVIGLLSIPGVARGQVLISLLLGDKVSSEKFHLGIEGGVNLADVTGLGDTKMRTGFYLGIIGEWHFARNWYLQPALVPFDYLGAKNIPMSFATPPPEVDGIVSGNEVLLRYKYFSIPVLLKYGVANNRLLLGAGAKIAFLTSATDTWKGTSVDSSQVTVDGDIQNSIASTDAGVLFNLEWKFRPGAFSPSLVARGYLGLTDTIKDNPGDAVYNRAVTVLITVPIGGKKAAVDVGEDEDDS